MICSQSDSPLGLGGMERRGHLKGPNGLKQREKAIFNEFPGLKSW